MSDEEIADRIVGRFVEEGSAEAMRSLDPDYLARVKMRGEILYSPAYMGRLKEIILEELALRHASSEHRSR